ncbi:MAG: Tex-like N-terminal domain-containing protein, partial [Myxococcota bacterium]
MSGTGPVLALLQIPSDLQPTIEAAFTRVWAGRVIRSDTVEAGAEPPALAVIAGRDADAALKVAHPYEQHAPELMFLAVTDGARKLRVQRGLLPANVPWAVSTEELQDPRVLGLAMRLALEVGSRRRLERRLQWALPLAELTVKRQRESELRAALREQGKWTPELDAALVAAGTRADLEELYAPYKKRRATRADAAREKGL